MSESIAFAGEETIAAAADRVAAAVDDLAILARVLPDVESAERLDATTLRCVVRPGFSFLRGKLTATIAVTDAAQPRRRTFAIETRGIGTTIRVETTVAVEPLDAAIDVAARVVWTARVVELKGLVAAVSRPLIRAAAEDLIRKVWQRLRAELESPVTSS